MDGFGYGGIQAYEVCSIEAFNFEALVLYREGVYPLSRAKVWKDKGLVRRRNQTMESIGDYSSMMSQHALALVDISFRCFLRLLLSVDALKC